MFQTVAVQVTMAEDQVPFKLVEIPGKGQGLVASRKLYPGTIICTEKPLIMVNTVGALNEVYPVFQSLNEDDLQLKTIK